MLATLDFPLGSRQDGLILASIDVRTPGIPGIT